MYNIIIIKFSDYGCLEKVFLRIFAYEKYDKVRTLQIYSYKLFP